MPKRSRCKCPAEGPRRSSTLEDKANSGPPHLRGESRVRGRAVCVLGGLGLAVSVSSLRLHLDKAHPKYNTIATDPGDIDDIIRTAWAPMGSAISPSLSQASIMGLEILRMVLPL